MKTVEIKAFVPSKDYDLSKEFYQELGFELASESEGIAYFKSCNSSFLLQDFFFVRFAWFAFWPVWSTNTGSCVLVLWLVFYEFHQLRLFVCLLYW